MGEIMKNILIFCQQNYSWLFSGIGVAILVGIFGLFLRNRQNQKNIKNKIGNNSAGIQAGGNISIDVNGNYNNGRHLE